MKRLLAIIWILGCTAWMNAQTLVDADEIIKTARQYIGCPYSYGATGPNRFDCSGFVQFCFAKHAIFLPRNSASQSNEGVTVSGGWDKLQTGDLVFFGKGRVSHVGIYVGTPSAHKHEFIHASSSQGITISSLEDGYWSKRYKFARRLNLVASEPIIVTDTDFNPSSSASLPQTAVGTGTSYADSKIDESAVTYKTRRWKTKVNRKNRVKVVWKE